MALREGDWMLVGYLEPPGYEFAHPLQKKDMAYIDTSKISQFELYNLRKDIGQTTDVSEKYPDQFQQMIRKMKALHRNVLSEKPSWNF